MTGTLLYQNAFVYFKFGYGAALAWVLAHDHLRPVDDPAEAGQSRRGLRKDIRHGRRPRHIPARPRAPDRRGCQAARVSRHSMILIYAVLILAAIAFVLPFYWMVVSSFRPTAQFLQAPDPAACRIRRRWRTSRRSSLAPCSGVASLNSVFLAVVSVILQVWFCALAGYTFAKLRFRGRDALFVGVLATMMIPLGVGLIPNFIIMARIGWVDTYRAADRPRHRQRLRRLLDAAVLSLGAGRAARRGARRRHRRVRHLLAHRAADHSPRPGLAGHLRLSLHPGTTFCSRWSSCAARRSSPSSSGCRSSPRQGNVGQPAIVMAGSVLASIPIVIMFAALQRHFIAGLTAGSNK